MTRGRERGWALVSVLWTLAVLAMLVSAAQSLSYNVALRESRALADAQSDAMFEAGVTRAVLGLSDMRPDKRWRVDGTPQTFQFGGDTLRIAIQDEFGRIDLNAADGSLINQLLVSAGLPKDDADRLTDRILDWRSRDDGLSRLHGATDDSYAQAGLAYRPRHGAFQTVDELRLVLGMTPALFERVRPALTVYSHHPAIDTSVAPREALLAYYPNQPERVVDLVASRDTDADGNAHQGLPALPATLAGRAFEILVQLPERHRTTTRKAVVMLTGDSEIPYLTLLWR